MTDKPGKNISSLKDKLLRGYGLPSGGYGLMLFRRITLYDCYCNTRYFVVETLSATVMEHYESSDE